MIGAGISAQALPQITRSYAVDVRKIHVTIEVVVQPIVTLGDGAIVTVPRTVSRALATGVVAIKQSVEIVV